MFESHPAPAASEVTWHLGEIQLGVGEAEGEFESHPLETEGDWVTARLTVHHLTLEDSGGLSILANILHLKAI